MSFKSKLFDKSIDLSKINLMGGETWTTCEYSTDGGCDTLTDRQEDTGSRTITEAPVEDC